MKLRVSSIIGCGAVVVAVASLVPTPAAGQTSPVAKVNSAGKAWTAPKTPDGQPDLQGVWTNATITPFERPVALGGKAFLSQEEVANLEKQTAVQRQTSDEGPGRKGDVGAYNQFWMDSGTRVLSTRQTSLVVDPPDGRVPATPAAERKRDQNSARIGDSYEYMSVWDRCITRGMPGAMFPAGYNNAYQILQVPGYVVILHEMIHDTRIIPVDGRPHVGGGIRLWNGDSRGRWEGNTLVVETTNFSDRGWVATSAATGRVKGIPQTEALHVVERFTRVDPDTIAYEVTVTDPNIYTKPWTVAFPLAKDQSYQIYEYACHEGNKAVPNILSGGRAAEGPARVSLADKK
jgi:hypothetical protein